MWTLEKQSLDHVNFWGLDWFVVWLNSSLTTSTGFSCRCASGFYQTQKRTSACISLKRTSPCFLAFQVLFKYSSKSPKIKIKTYIYCYLFLVTQNFHFYLLEIQKLVRWVISTHTSPLPPPPSPSAKSGCVFVSQHGVLQLLHGCILSPTCQVRHGNKNDLSSKQQLHCRSQMRQTPGWLDDPPDPNATIRAGELNYPWEYTFICVSLCSELQFEVRTLVVAAAHAQVNELEPE